MFWDLQEGCFDILWLFVINTIILLVWYLARAIFQGQYFCVCLLELVTEVVCAEFSSFSPTSVQNVILHFHIL